MTKKKTTLNSCFVICLMIEISCTLAFWQTVVRKYASIYKLVFADSYDYLRILVGKQTGLHCYIKK